MRITLQPAYILHNRPFNESSALLDVFTLMYGRIHLIARSARSMHSRFRGLLRPFIPLLISWSGKTELMSLHAVEVNGAMCYLQGSSLLNGIYLNELLVRVLPRFDAHPNLFMIYQETLQQLYQQNAQETNLRLFEKQLLQEVGYGLQLHKEAITGEPILPHEKYVFIPGKGFVKNQPAQRNLLALPGKALLALHNGSLTEPDDLRWAKRLTRLAIAELLGNKPVRSRELWVL